MVSIYNKFETEIIPAINANIVEIKSFPAKIAESAKQITNQMQTKITDYVDNTVLPPLLAMKDTFVSVGDGLKNDIQIVVNQGTKMTNNMKAEMVKIKDVFVGFGTNIKNQATGIANGAKKVGDELVEAVREIKVPLDQSIAWAKKIPKHARKLDFIAMGIDAFNAIGYLVLTTRAGQKGVIPEMSEGFSEISGAFTGLKNNFNSFGNTLKNESTNIGNQIQTSTTNIKNNTDAFLLSFKSTFDNMSTRIKGGTANVVKEINITKAKPPKVIITKPPTPPRTIPRGGVIGRPPILPPPRPPPVGRVRKPPVIIIPKTRKPPIIRVRRRGGIGSRS